MLFVGKEGIDQFDTAVFEIARIPGRDRKPVDFRDGRNLAVWYAHRVADFPPEAHDIAIGTGCRFVVGQYALREG